VHELVGQEIRIGSEKSYPKMEDPLRTKRTPPSSLLAGRPAGGKKRIASTDANLHHAVERPASKFGTAH